MLEGGWMQGAYAQAILFVLGLAVSSAAFIGVVFRGQRAAVAQEPQLREGNSLRVRHGAGR